MTQTTESTTSALQPAGAEGIRESLRGKYVCPFCGSVNDNEQGTCPRCTMENSAATRKATKTRIGPWYVLQTRNPAAPGMTWETLIGFIRKGRVKPRSIVRGPTTHQLWRFAAHVKGLSREFGICYSCGSTVEPTATLCPQCNRLQDPPPNPDALLEASREGQQTYTTPPATIDGTVLAGASTISTTVAAVNQTAPPPSPPPDDAEFVIPALGGYTGLETPALAMPPASEAPTPRAPAAGSAPAASDARAERNAAAPVPGVTPASAGPATPPTNYQGISGDPSWTRIGNGGANESRGRGGTANSGAPRPAAPRANGAANPNAPKFNPYADDDLPSQSGRRSEGEGFLSAKDLAAAFNLGFVGEEDDDDGRGAAALQRGGRNARGKGASNDAMSFGDFAAMGMGGGYGTPSGRSKLKIFFALTVLVIMGLGVALAVSSDLRQAVRKWFNSATSGLNKESDSDQLGSPGSNQKKLNGPGKNGRQPAEPPTENLPPRPGNPATGPTTEPDDNSATPASATRPASVPPPNTAHISTPVTPPSPPVTPPVPATRPANPLEHPAPATAPATPPAPTPWAQSDAAKLYREGITLENSDPALALARYKEIQRRFPPESWPSDLNDRIKRMSEKLKKLYGG